MEPSVIALIVAAATWTLAESALILRDRAGRKGSVQKDRGTRNLTTIATVLVLLGAPALTWLTASGWSRFHAPEVLESGIIVMCLGFLLRHWSISVLGAAFRTTVEIHPGQRVVRTGPYRFIRHPAYSGIILFFAGYGMATGSWFSLAVSIILPTAALLSRISVEERELAAGMGDDYRRYQADTKKLVPFIW